MKNEFLMCLALAVGLGGLPRAEATTIDPLTWEQLVSSADLVGIVECETAGGIVAKYTVVESWKGPPAGSALSLAVAVNYWEPQFPIALCGERYLVTAYRVAAPSRVMSTTSGGPVPLWWRQIPADYRLPLFQGRVALPLAERERPLTALGSTHRDLESFRAAVLEFLALEAGQQEVRLWRRLSEKYLLERGGGKDGSLDDRMAEFKREMAAWTMPAQWVTNLMALARQQTNAGYNPVWEVLRQGCTSNTLHILESIPGHEIVPQHTLQGIRYRLESKNRSEPSQTKTNELSPSAEVLAKARVTLQAGRRDSNFGQAFETLVQHDPGAVAEYFRTWRNEGKQWTDKNAAFELGSYFAWRCGKERFRHLQSLLEAREPFVRVAGAVYGCFENEAWGVSNLKKQMLLEDDPGAWAALNLARRGEKTALPRALEVLATRGPYGMAGVPHRNLQKRLMVLLSNSAKASGLPQPVPPPSDPEGEEGYKALHKFYAQWWDLNKARMTLQDPWLAMLIKQKVD